MAFAIGLLARPADADSGVTFFMSLLPYPSVAFILIDTILSWLQGSPATTRSRR